MLKSRLATALLSITLLLCPAIGIAAEAPSKDNRPSFEVVKKKHWFKPLELIVPAYKKFKLTVKNRSDDTIAFDSPVIGNTHGLDHGEDETIEVNALPPGTYEYEDAFDTDNKAFITAK